VCWQADHIDHASTGVGQYVDHASGPVSRVGGRGMLAVCPFAWAVTYADAGGGEPP